MVVHFNAFKFIRFHNDHESFKIKCSLKLRHPFYFILIERYFITMTTTKVRIVLKTLLICYIFYIANTEQHMNIFFSNFLQFILVGAIVAMCFLSFDSVEGQCLACAMPYGPYCCKTSFGGKCCDFPFGLSPLARQLKNKQESNP